MPKAINSESLAANTHSDVALDREVTFGSHLRRWRALRGWSQLDLSAVADVSSRHVSFLETGRSHPSREMIHRLSSALELPLRDRNLLLTTAGYAPAFRDRPLGTEALAPVRKALEIILERHQPYPAFVLDAEWNILMANRAHHQILSSLLEEPPRAANAIRLLFDPELLRPHVRNFDVCARVLGRRIERQLQHPGLGASRRRTLHGLLEYPGVRTAMRQPWIPPSSAILIPLELQFGEQVLSWFSTIATLGTPLEITLEELRIETLFPADPRTAELVAQLFPD